MQVVAALLDQRAALAVLRRSRTPGGPSVVACRSVAGLARVLATQVVEAVVLGGKAARRLDLAPLRDRFPGVPLVIHGVIRSEDAELLLKWQRLGVAAVSVEGMDDGVLGEVVARTSVSARRAAALADWPGLLRLTEPLQRRAWDLMVAKPDRRTRTSGIARTLGVSREHLSRQFGAGGAPTLKRVSDLVGVMAALDLLRNPGLDQRVVAGLLGYTTPSHLRAVIRRVTGLAAPDAVRLPEREVAGRFLRAGRR